MTTYRSVQRKTQGGFDAIEARLLDFAFTTDAAITAPALAYFAPCSVDDASAVLERLAARGTLTMDVRDDGSIVYAMPGRQRFGASPTAPAPIPVLTPQVIRPQRQRPSASVLLAAFLSVWSPGAGHLYSGRVAAAVLWFFAVGLGYMLILPGLVLHLFCVVSAMGAAQRTKLLAEPPRRLMLGSI